MWALALKALHWLRLVFGDEELINLAGRVVATGLLIVAMLFLTMTWALGIIAQPGGIYWLAAQSPQTQVLLPVTTSGSPPVATAPVAALPIAPVPQVTDAVQSMLAQARTWIGTPYQWGGCSVHGVDCSCFVRNVLKVAGIDAPRTTIYQKPWTRPVPLAQAQPGDLLFFDNTCTGCGANPTHVGMYIGGGLMIHAGDPVHIESIQTSYWQSHFDSAGRPPGL